MPGIFRFGIDNNNYSAALLSQGPHTDEKIQNQLKKLREHIVDLEKALATAEKTGKPAWVAKFDTDGEIAGAQSSAKIKSELAKFKEGVEGLRFLTTQDMRNAFETVLHKMYSVDKNFITPVDKEWVEATLKLTHNVLADIHYHACTEQESSAALNKQGFGYLFRASSQPGHITFSYKTPDGGISNIRIPYQINENGIVFNEKEMMLVDAAIRDVHLGLDKKGISRMQAIIQSTVSVAPNSTATLMAHLNRQAPISAPVAKPPVTNARDSIFTGGETLLTDIKSITAKGQNANKAAYNNQQVLLAEKSPEALNMMTNIHLESFIYANKKGFATLQKELVNIVKMNPAYQDQLRRFVNEGKSNPLLHLLSIDQKTGKPSEQPTSAMKDLCKLLKINPKEIKALAQNPSLIDRPPSPSRLRRS